MAAWASYEIIEVETAVVRCSSEGLSNIRPWKVVSILLEELHLSKASDRLLDYCTHCVLSVKAADVMDEGR